MSTDPHTLDAVLAHREALLAQFDALREEVLHLRGSADDLIDRNIKLASVRACLVAELDAWHALARDYTLDADAEGMDLVNAMRSHCDFERLWVSSLRAKGSQLIAERDAAYARGVEDGRAERRIVIKGPTVTGPTNTAPMRLVQIRCSDHHTISVHEEGRVPAGWETMDCDFCTHEREAPNRIVPYGGSHE